MYNVKIKATEYEKLKSEVEYLQLRIDTFRKLAFKEDHSVYLKVSVK